MRDRFGDYGLVGVMMFETKTDALCVDTFLLSCRALGRGVEHRMLARLGEITVERGLGRVDVRYAPTQKNRPALDFLEQVGMPFRHPLNNSYLFKLSTKGTKAHEKEGKLCSFVFFVDASRKEIPINSS